MEQQTQATSKFNVLLDSAVEYAQRFKEVEGAQIPSPSMSLQSAIRQVGLSDFNKGFTSEYTFKELQEISYKEEKDLFNFIKDNSDSNLATIMCLTLLGARHHLTGKYRSQIDFILTVIADKPDRNEMIWKSTINK